MDCLNATKDLKTSYQCEARWQWRSDDGNDNESIENDGAELCESSNREILQDRYGARQL